MGIVLHLRQKAAERTQREAACEALSSEPDRGEELGVRELPPCSAPWLGTTSCLSTDASNSTHVHQMNE